MSPILSFHPPPRQPVTSDRILANHRSNVTGIVTALQLALAALSSWTSWCFKSVRSARPGRLSLQIIQSLAQGSNGVSHSSIDNYLQGDRNRKFAFGCC
jgi:hypothetical protein